MCGLPAVALSTINSFSMASYTLVRGRPLDTWGPRQMLALYQGHEARAYCIFVWCIKLAHDCVSLTSCFRSIFLIATMVPYAKDLRPLVLPLRVVARNTDLPPHNRL